MRRLIPLVSFACSLWSVPAFGQVGATVYSDGRVVIRRELPIPLPIGLTTVRIALREVDPSTLVALDAGVHVVRVRFPGAESDQSVLQRLVGRRLGFLTPRGDTAFARLLSTRPLRLELPSGTVSFVSLGQPLYPRDVVAPRDSVELTVSAVRAVERFRFGYQTTGATWRARYVIRTGRPTAAISGAAVLMSDVVDLDSAEVSLYAGQVGSPPVPASPAAYRLDEIVVTGTARSMAAATLEPAVETVGPHRVYQLPGRFRIAPGETILVPLFEPIAVVVERIHRIDGQASPLGPTAPGTPAQEIPIQIQYRADRPAGSDFGNRALPAGIVAIFGGGLGRETLVGESRIGHTPPNAPFEIMAGRALDVRAFRSSSGYQMVQDSVLNPNGSLLVRTTAQAQTFDWLISNGSDSTVVAEVIERRPGRWRVVQSTVPADSIDGGKRFRFPVEAHGEAKLSYRIRVEGQ